MPLDIQQIRQQFPALSSSTTFFDNPAGTQVPTRVIDRMIRYLRESNANHGGGFQTSITSDAIIDETRQAAADFLGAARSEEIIFGPNMTSLAFMLSRMLAPQIEKNDTIVVTRLDHDANITPWTQMAEERGAKVEWIDFDVEDGTLKIDQFESVLESKPKLVAVGYASNALGTINPVHKITQMAKQAGALVFIDAVQYAPHGPIDVQDLGCDFLACSSYKFFGPHLGLLYGRYDLLESLPTYQVRPASQTPPGVFERGTKNHEGIAGLLGAFEYMEWVGKTFGWIHKDKYVQRYDGRALLLKQAITAIRAYEFEISRQMLAVLNETPGIRLYGLNDPLQIENRVPTFAFNVEGVHPHQVAEKMANNGIAVWDGNYYALAVTERLGVEDSGGMVRVGPVHYNTVQEITRFKVVLDEILK